MLMNTPIKLNLFFCVDSYFPLPKTAPMTIGDMNPMTLGAVLQILNILPRPKCRLSVYILSIASKIQYLYFCYPQESPKQNNESDAFSRCNDIRT